MDDCAARRGHGRRRKFSSAEDFRKSLKAYAEEFFNLNLRDWSGQSILEKAQTRREGPGGEVWYRRNLHELTIQTELTPALQILFSRYLDYARGIGSNGFSAPMTWESLMAWRHETDEPQLTRFERDCFFSLRSVHQEIAAKKAEKPKETRG